MPDTYQVRSGDTITSVSEHFGIPTTMLLSLNGLSWNSILHEGQVVRLTATPSKQRGMAPPRVSSNQYQVEPGDSLRSIAERLGISVQALASANALDPLGDVAPGDILTLPGSQADLAPRVIPVSAERKTPAVVFASATRPADAQDEEGAEAASAEEEPADGESDSSDDQSAAAETNPLVAEIMEAPSFARNPNQSRRQLPRLLLPASGARGKRGGRLG